MMIRRVQIRTFASKNLVFEGEILICVRKSICFDAKSYFLNILSP